MKTLFATALAFSICFLISCSGDSDPIADVEPVTIGSINVDSDAINDSDRMFYSVHGDDGSDLGSGEVVNGDLIQIESVYEGTKIAINLYRWNAETTTVTVKSYVDMTVGETIHLTSPFPEISTTRADVSFLNQPSSYEEIIIAGPRFQGTTVPFSLSDGQVFKFPVFEDTPFTLVTTRFASGAILYQSVDLSLDSENIIDLDNSLMNERNQIEMGVEFETASNFTFRVNMAGLRDTESIREEDYRIYNDPDVLLLAGGSGTFTRFFYIYTPTIFENFRLNFTATSGTTTYGQITIGEVPLMFEFLEADATATGTFSSLDISATGTDVISYLESSWEKIDSSNRIFWNVISPASTDTNFEISNIPQPILDEIEFLSDAASVELTRVTMFNMDDLAYEEALSRMLDPSPSDKILSKDLRFD